MSMVLYYNVLYTNVQISGFSYLDGETLRAWTVVINVEYSNQTVVDDIA